MTTSDIRIRCDGDLGENRAYVLGSHLPFVGTVEPGQLLTVRTLDASGNQIREGGRAEDLDQSALFPVSGPVELAGAGKGDAVGLEIVDIRLADEAHCWTRSGIGIGPDLGYHVRRFSLPDAHWPDLPGIDLDLRPHVGTLGVLPSARRLARDLGDYGGNLDSVEIAPGAVLWVKSHRAGAGIFAGDVHASIGDAEICGTGLETSAEIDLRARIRRDWSSAHPVVVQDGRTWLIGIAATLDAALRKGCAAVIAALAAHLDVPDAEAYLLAAQLLDVRVCQVVNPNASVSISLRQGLDVCLGPPPADDEQVTTGRVNR